MYLPLQVMIHCLNMTKLLRLECVNSLFQPFVNLSISLMYRACKCNVVYPSDYVWKQERHQLHLGKKIYPMFAWEQNDHSLQDHFSQLEALLKKWLEYQPPTTDLHMLKENIIKCLSKWAHTFNCSSKLWLITL